MKILLLSCVVALQFFFFNHYVFAQEYTVAWGEDSIYATRKEAMDATLLRAVSDASTHILGIKENTPRYQALQALLLENSRYLTYILQYAERPTPPYIAQSSESAQNREYATFDITVDTQALAKFYASLGSGVQQKNFSLKITANAKEQQHIASVFSRYALVVGLQQTVEAPIAIEVLKKNDGYYQATCSTPTNTELFQEITLEQLWVALWKTQQIFSVHTAQAKSIHYILVVENIPSLDRVQSLDAILTQGIARNLGSIQLIDFTEQQNTQNTMLSARWECTMHKEAEYLSTLRKILAIYPELQYKLVAQK